jgi:hypothetical protein
MNRFCQTKNLLDLAFLTPKENEQASQYLSDLDPNRVGITHKPVFYILYSYYHPYRLPKAKPVSVLKFCEKYSSLSIPVDRLLGTVYVKTNLSGLRPDLSNISLSHMKKLFKIVDTIYFSGQIQSRLNETYSTVSFRLVDEKPEHLMGGRCQANGCSYRMSFYIGMIKGSFESNPNYRLVGLKQCLNPLMCLIFLFLHEIVHLVTILFCLQDEPHGKVFKDILRSISGQTGIYHDLIIE